MTDASIAVAFATGLAALAALLSAYCAWSSLQIAKRLERQAAGDEVIKLGPLDYAQNVDPAHRQNVISCVVVNPSRQRGGYIDDVRAYDELGKEIEIQWSSSIDSFGARADSGYLIAVPSQASLYIRRSDGDLISYMRIDAHHSFADAPATRVFSILGDTAEYPAEADAGA